MQSKLANIGPTVFSVMSKLAADHGAINLGQGFPGFPIDGRLSAAVTRAMNNGFNQYAPMSGMPGLRAKILEKFNSAYGSDYLADSEVTVTAGATQAIYTAIAAFVHAGDEVILFAPAYDCYAPAVALHGGVCKWVHLHWPTYSVNWQEVKDLITDRTRMIVVNTPHNPTGSTWSKEDLRQLELLVRGTSILVLSDEVYEHMVFDGKAHESLAQLKSLKEQMLLVYSFGKTFHATGWKMGYVIGAKALMNEFQKVHQYMVFSCHSAVQVGLTDYLSYPEMYLELSDFYQRKRDFFLSFLEGSAWKWQVAEGTYFQLMNYHEIRDEEDTKMAIDLTVKHGVASIPISVFYPNPVNDFVLRFCFAKENEVLEKAALILSAIR